MHAVTSLRYKSCPFELRQKGRALTHDPIWFKAKRNFTFEARMDSKGARLGRYPLPGIQDGARLGRRFLPGIQDPVHSTKHLSQRARALRHEQVMDQTFELLVG